MRVLLVSHTDLTAACTLNMLVLAKELERQGDDVVLLYAGNSDPEDIFAGGCNVVCHRIEFDGVFLFRKVKRAIVDFAPDIIHLWGMRHIGQRVALECVIATGALFVLHWEDDEYWVYRHQGGVQANDDVLRLSDHPALTAETVSKIVSSLSIESCFQTFVNPWQYDGVHPMYFAVLSHLAVGFTAIWTPLRDFLHQTFSRPVRLLPPAYDLKELKPRESAGSLDLRESLGIPPEGVLVVSTGSVYEFSVDFHILLAGFVQAWQKNENIYFLMCGQNHRRKELAGIVERSGFSSNFRMLGRLTKSDTQDLIAAADLVVCPGEDNEFNYLRLPSRVPEYMAMGKAMLICEGGFGESLRDKVDAFVMKEDTPEAWATGLLLAAENSELRQQIGVEARKTAECFFDVEKVASGLRSFYESILSVRCETAALAETSPVSDMELAKALLRLIPRLIQKGFSSFYLYGAGAHTRRFLKIYDCDCLEILGVLDDFSFSKDIDGLPVLRPENVEDRSNVAVLVSTDTIPEKLYQSALGHGFKNVFKLY